jgi:hypothetical protein
MNKKILIISPYSTHPPYGGNSKCILSYSEMLQEIGYSVSFLWIADFNESKETEELTRLYWKDKLFIFRLSQFHRIIKALFRYSRFYFRGYYKVDDFHPFGIKNYINQLQKSHYFDCIIINYIFLSKIFTYITRSKKILYTHDVFTNRFQKTGNPWFSVTANEEAKALNRADVVFGIQDSETTFFSYLTTSKVKSVFTHFRVTETPFVGKKVLLFLAAKNPNNVDGISKFIETVFRPLALIYPELKLVIGGSICSVIDEIFDDESIEYLGEVDDLENFYKLGDIFINPTFNGTGLKIKTFEALSFGKVVLSHPHNVIGIYNKEHAPILICSDSDKYIRTVDYLFVDKENVLAIKAESIKYIWSLNSYVKLQFTEAIDN